MREPEFPIPYARKPQTLGEHVRRTRLFRGLTQRTLAHQLGVTEQAVAFWEQGRVRPRVRHHGALVRFLGANPEPAGDSFPERLRAFRRRHALTQAELAARAGIDPGSLTRWESGSRKPSTWMVGRVETVMAALDGVAPKGERPLSYFDLTRWGRRPPAGLGLAEPTHMGERVRRWRLEQGLSQAELARRLGVSRVRLHRWERGLRSPDAEALAALGRLMRRLGAGEPGPDGALGE